MRMLCLGDSLTYGYDVPKMQQWTYITSRTMGIDIQNEGLCGDTTAGMQYRFRLLDLSAYDLFFLMGGVNDIFQELPVHAAKENLAFMADAAARKGMAVLVGIPPLTRPESVYFGWQRREDVMRHNEYIRQLGQYLRDLCRDRGYYSADFAAAMETAEEVGKTGLYADGVHPSAQGYAVFAAAACDVLAKVIC